MKPPKPDVEKIMTVNVFRKGSELVGEYTTQIGSAKYSGQITFKDYKQIPDVCKHVAQMWEDQVRRLGLR